MDTLYDYLKWRGDLSFSEVLLGEADSVILSMLSYIDFEKLCGSEITPLSVASNGYCSDGKYDSINLGLIMPSKQINRMFCEMSKTRRFANVTVSDYVSRTNVEEGYQFAAMTFHLSREHMAVVFRGTDDSIAGWREDCRLAFLDSIPAQRMAVEYLEDVAERYTGKKIFIMGHSKGGNMAVYSAVKCSDAVRERVVRAFSLDGPGLSRSTVDSEEYERAEEKLTILLPQSSYIGTMFERGEKYSVVVSRGNGLLQHDPFTWCLRGPRFLKFKSLSNRGKKNEEQFRKSMDKMSADEKRELVEGMFNIVESTGAQTLTDLTKQSHKKLAALIKTYGGLDKEQRKLITMLLFKLLDLK